MSERILIPVHDPMEKEWAEKFWPERPKLYGDCDIRCPRCGGAILIKTWRTEAIDTYFLKRGYRTREDYKECEYCPDCGQHIDWSFSWEDEE